jgi:tRNA(Ser,Leu) C12 N-acetylase TAN1
MTVERRTDTMRLDPDQVIRSLAELIDARVDLDRPDKILLVQLFDDWVALSIVAPSETFSVVKVVPARSPHARAADPADRTPGG